jgi:hypothetical protein
MESLREEPGGQGEERQQRRDRRHLSRYRPSSKKGGIFGMSIPFLFYFEAFTTIVTQN